MAAIASAAALTALPLRPSFAQEATGAVNVPRVAVFGEPGFPSWFLDDKATPPPPDAIVARLQSLGISAEVVHADALADVSRFNAGQYSLLVLPYGNCYPRDALQNLQTFHRERGGFVLTGIPFMHPVARERGAAEGWSANPGWGEYVHVAPGAGRRGENALVLHGGAADWVGTGSARFAVHSGEAIRLSAWFKDQGAKPGDTSHLFLRFWDTNGNFIGQSGFPIDNAPDWQLFSGTVTVPEKAVDADVSPQLWNDPHRELSMTDLAVLTEGRTVPVKNGTFARAGDHWRDTGDGGKDAALFGSKGVGVGFFAGPDGSAKPYAAAPDDPLEMASLGYAWTQTNRTQWLDPNSLPETDTIIPLVGTRVHPVAALVVHHSDDYRGVVDAWVYEGPGGENDTAGMGQMIVRGVVAALRQQEHLSDARARACFAALNRLVSGKPGTADHSAGKSTP